MKKKRIIGIFVIVLVIIEITSIFLMYKSGTNSKTVLDTVKLNEIEKNNTFAIMVEQDGEYIESETFPTDGYILNETFSGCIDGNGNTLSNVLTYDDGVLTVKTRTNALCYLYFDIETAADYLINNVSSDVLWESTLEDDGYRYVGTDPNNYICFGTTDTNTCTSDTDKYMYRIIGIFEGTDGEQHLKLIKKEALNTAYYWHSSNTDIDWDESDLYKGINGSYFLTNTTYSYMQDSTWTNKIATWDYTATNTQTIEFSSASNYGVSYNTASVKLIYLHEMNRPGLVNETHYWSDGTLVDVTLGEWKTVSAKIGLMYVSDYLLSLGSSAIDYVIKSKYSTLKTGWMHITNNDSASLSTTEVAPPSNLEGVMSRYGANNSGGYMWYIDSGGAVMAYYVNYAPGSARPVFYLEVDTKIASGTGTSDDPYIIH